MNQAVLANGSYGDYSLSIIFEICLAVDISKTGDQFWKKILIYWAFSINFFAPTAMAQNVIAPAPAPIVTLAPAQMNKLQQGTPVSLRLLRELTTKDKALKVGDRFDLELVDPIKLGTITVIPSGTRAVGEIMSVRNKGMWGKSGHFDARLMYLRVGERMIRLAGSFDDKGKAGGWGAAAVSGIVFLPAGFFMTGTSATVAAGTIVKGSLDEDVPVVIEGAKAEPPLVATPQGIAPISATPTP